MENDFTEVKQDIKEIKEKIHSIDITMAENTLSLKEHMAQTALLRDMVLPLHTERIGRLAVNSHKKDNFYKWAKILVTAATVITTVITILKIKGIM